MADTLRNVLKTADTAVYEFDGYYVYVSDETIEGNGFYIAICKEAMPPHATGYQNSIDDVEDFLLGTLGYTERGAAVWESADDDSSPSCEIAVRSYSIQSPATRRQEMDGLRQLCADLSSGISQEKRTWDNAYGEDGLDHLSIFVHAQHVGMAVHRINEAGYATDSDEDEDVESES